MDVLVIVPHFDDAVFSIGDHLHVLARRHSVHVATVFGRGTDESTSFDQASGFESGVEAIRARWVENELALADLGITSQSAGPFCDAQYDEPADQGEVVDHVRGLLRMMRPQVVVALLGLHHPDHLQLAAAVEFVADEGHDTFVAEDLPYRVLWPEKATRALRRECYLFASSTGRGSDVKRGACERYGSQLWSLDLHSVMMPERLWRRAG